MLDRGRLLDHLGRPPSWSLIPRQLHPLTPERVVILPGGDGPAVLGEKVVRDRLKGIALPEEKLRVVLRLMHVLTRTYAAPELFEPWALTLARREALGTTGMGHGFGLVHQFQNTGEVRLINGEVDWWLFLFPAGVEWEALDGEPVFGLVGHVFPGNHQRPGSKLRAYELSCRAAREVTVRDGEGEPGWARLARLDARSAAEEYNRAILRVLRE